MFSTPVIRKANYNYSINGFRGLCVLLVFIFHIENSRLIPSFVLLGDLQQPLLWFLSSFRYGVEMFFMISGYVIVGSLRRHATLRAFFIDRALRIYPAWIPLHVLLFATIPFLDNRLLPSHAELCEWTGYFFADLFFLPPIIPLPLAHPAAWSLSYEWLFYIIAAIAAFLGRGSIGKHKTAIAVGITGVVLINLFPRGLFFLPGVILALNEKKIKAHIGYLKFPFAALMIFLAAWRATDVDNAALSIMLIDWCRDIKIIFAIVAFIAGTYLFFCIALEGGKLSRLLGSPFFQFFGNISYSLYLWSPIVMFPVKRFVLGTVSSGWGAVILFASLSFAISVLTAWLSWRSIEGMLTTKLRGYLQVHKKAAA